MKQNIAKKWVEALRSGEFKQDKGQLKSYKGYCCLGVLCELAAKEGVGYFESGHFIDSKGARNATFLSNVVSEWSGVKSFDGSFTAQLKDRMAYTNLAYLNDGTHNDNYKGLTFKQIADVIEAYAEDL